MSHSQAVIIDDNAKNINVLARLLSTEGLKSLEVLNASKLDTALKQANDVSVFFVDLEMPGVNGYQVLEKLKADTRFKSVPVIAYTVHVSEINVAHQKGFDGFIGKPLDADVFPDQLARILSGESVWETP
jgi:two-component system, cell cycle response regulator DivK